MEVVGAVHGVYGAGSAMGRLDAGQVLFGAQEQAAMLLDPLVYFGARKEDVGLLREWRTQLKHRAIVLGKVGKEGRDVAGAQVAI